MNQEEKLSRNSVESIAAIMTDAVILCDSKGVIKFCNNSAVRIFGYNDPGELIDHNVNIFVRPESRDEHDRHLLGNESHDGEVRYVKALKKNGRMFPISLTLTKYNNNNKIEYIAIARDLSTIYGNAEILKGILHESPFLFFVYFNARFEYINTQFEIVFDTTLDKVNSMPMMHDIAKQIRLSDGGQWIRMDAGEPPQELAWQNVTLNGKVMGLGIKQKEVPTKETLLLRQAMDVVIENQKWINKLSTS